MEQTHRQQRHVASPHSTASSAASHGHVYAPGPYSTAAMGPGGLGIGPSAGPSADPRLAVPVTTAANQTTSWHQPSAHYSNDLSSSGRWYGATDYLHAAPATGMPGSGAYQSYQRFPPMTSQSMAADVRLMPLHEYDSPGQPTSTS